MKNVRELLKRFESNTVETEPVRSRFATVRPTKRTSIVVTAIVALSAIATFFLRRRNAVPTLDTLQEMIAQGDDDSIRELAKGNSATGQLARAYLERTRFPIDEMKPSTADRTTTERAALPDWNPEPPAAKVPPTDTTTDGESDDQKDDQQV